MASSTSELKIPLIATISVVGIILLGAITVAVQAWFAWETERAQADKLESATHTQLNQIKTQNSQAWVTEPTTREQDGVAIRKVPIEDAMKMVVEQAGKPAPATQPDHNDA